MITVTKKDLVELEYGISFSIDEINNNQLGDLRRSINDLGKHHVEALESLGGELGSMIFMSMQN